jgi:hypothetical protein
MVKEMRKYGNMGETFAKVSPKPSSKAFEAGLVYN